MKRAESFCKNSPPFFVGHRAHKHGDAMIWQVAVKLNEICVLGRDYPWPRPQGCLRCGSARVWGHGFVGRYFDGFDQALWLRCYRCPECRCVMTPRPMGYVRRVQATVAWIREELAHRLECGRWRRPPGSRMRHWLRNLRRHALAWRGWREGQRLLDAFDRLLAAGWVPVGRVPSTPATPALPGHPSGVCR